MTGEQLEASASIYFNSTPLLDLTSPVFHLQRANTLPWICCDTALLVKCLSAYFPTYLYVLWAVYTSSLKAYCVIDQRSVEITAELR
jgi:hypothetical protein